MYYKHWHIETVPGKLNPRTSSDLSNEAYHSDYSHISSSWLKLGFDSLYGFMKHPLREKEDPTPAMVLGSATHTLLLEPEKFYEQYVVLDRDKMPAPDKTLSYGPNKAYAQNLKASGKQMIDKKWIDEAMLYAKGPRENAFISKILQQGYKEHSMLWNCAVTGLPLKSRPDVFTAIKNNTLMVMDVKTAIGASHEEFSKVVSSSHHDLQAALQIDGIEAVTGQKVSRYLYLVLEKAYPYEYCLYELNEDDIDYGRSKYQAILERIKNCVSTDAWPGYTETYQLRKGIEPNPLNIVKLELPAYHYNR